MTLAAFALGVALGATAVVVWSMVVYVIDEP